ncbi:MAG: peptidoglycan DD-metalloendopeptidase family protein [Acidimicrobiia bacterium]|nr:peptidoglycan DD-metalloendopeptidase family protein [Acidimicrobiia bacterium]
MAGRNRAEFGTPVRTRVRTRLLAAVAVSASLAGAAFVPAVASAQEQTTTTTTSTTTTTLPPAPPTSPEEPGPPTTLTPAPPSAPQPGVNPQDNLLLLQQQQQQRLAQLQAEADALANQMAEARKVLDELDLDVENVNGMIEDVLHKLEGYREGVRQRAVAAYKGDTTYVSVLLDADSPSDFLSRVRFLAEANSGDQTKIERLEEQKVALEQQQEQLGTLRKQQRQKIAEMEQSQSQLGGKLNQMVGVLASLPSQQTIVVNGFVFPVSAPFTYSDDFGDYRAGPPPHPHQGNDIFCVKGSPLRASEAGRVEDVRERGLGGKSFWLISAAGTAYYYAHLDGYGPGIANGVQVTAGQILGFCGNTGNARTTPDHVHYEIHPGGREAPAINPYPILKATEQAMIASLGRQLGTGAGAATPGQPGSSTTPTTQPPPVVVPPQTPDPVPVQRAPRKPNVY